MFPNIPLVYANNTDTQLYEQPGLMQGTCSVSGTARPQQPQHLQNVVMVMVTTHPGNPSPCECQTAVWDGQAQSCGVPWQVAHQASFVALPWNHSQSCGSVVHQASNGSVSENTPWLVTADHADYGQAQGLYGLSSWYQTPGFAEEAFVPADQRGESCDMDLHWRSQAEQKTADTVYLADKAVPMMDHLSIASETLCVRQRPSNSNTSTIPASLDGIRSCTSSETSSLIGRRRHRRRRGRGGACLPVDTNAVDVALGVELPVGTAAQDVTSIKAVQVISMTADDGRKMMEKLRSGGAAARAAVAEILGSVFVLSLEAIGCRIVQAALDVGDCISREILVSEMRGHVREALRSPHANFVIQKIIEVMPVRRASFVSDELTGSVAEVARHRYGCRILCRLVEHHSGAESTATKILVDELLQDVAPLCHHSFARHVIESVLEHGTSEQRHKVAVEISRDMLHHARNRNASYIVERALSSCSIEDQRMIASEFLSSGRDRLVALAMHDCGSHVVKALLISKCTEYVKIIRQILKASEATLNTSKYGKRVLEEI